MSIPKEVIYKQGKFVTWPRCSCSFSVGVNQSEDAARDGVISQIGLIFFMEALHYTTGTMVVHCHISMASLLSGILLAEELRRVFT